MTVNIKRKFLESMKDLREQIKRDGWWRAGRWLAEKIISLPYCRIEYIVFARSLLDPLPVIEPRLPVDIRQAEKADLDRFEGLVSPSDLHCFRRQLAYGRHCFLALDGERLAAYCWATTQVEFDVDNIDISLQPGDTYLISGYTIPVYRRQAIQAALELYILAHMKRLGCCRAILMVAENNLASQGMVRKQGYRSVARLSFRRILWKRTFYYHPEAF